MAEGLFRKAVAGRPDYTVSSAGVSASKGSAASPETQMILTKRGARLEKFGSRLVTKAILDEATHVFAMTRDHLRILETRFPDHADKFQLVREFSGGAGKDVPDPIGMGRAAYEETADVLDAAIPTIIAYIDKTFKA